MPAIAATNALRVSNHSYVIVGGWWLWSPDGINYYWVWNGEVTISTNQDWHFGFYDAYARTNDQIIYTAQTYLPCSPLETSEVPTSEAQPLSRFTTMNT